MELLKEYFIPWTISNLVIVMVLIAAIRRPRLARLLLILMFAAAAWVNYSTAHTHPTDYLNYAPLTPISFYRDFIQGWFKDHIVSMVSMIALGQALIALGLLLKGWIFKAACIGAIIFFVAITPLGIGSAFPFPLIAITVIYFIMKKDRGDYLWNSAARK